MVIEHTGRSGLQALVKRHNALAGRLSELIEAEPDLEVLAPTILSVVCFRYAPVKFRGDDDALNRLNKKLMETLQAGGEIFLSGTTLRNRFALRACVLHYDTNEDDLSALIGAVRKVGNTILANVDHE